MMDMVVNFANVVKVPMRHCLLSPYLRKIIHPRMKIKTSIQNFKPPESKCAARGILGDFSNKSISLCEFRPARDPKKNFSLLLRIPLPSHINPIPTNESVSGCRQGWVIEYGRPVFLFLI